MNNVIEIRGLRKDYKNFSLKNIDLTMPSGHVMGLIGPNGAGKTTLIKLIMNLIRRDAGEIKVFGQDNIRREPEIKARIGFVYDVPRFHEDVKLRDIKSALAPFYRHWDDGRFFRLADEFRLPLGTAFKKLSHGMKMKFSLAIALSHNADLLLMDEPTSGLDPDFRLELLEKIQSLMQDERKSILFSTHITSDLERIADYITFIHRGSIVFSSAREEIFENWGLVKAGGESLRPEDIPGLRGFRRSEFGVEALTSCLAEARDCLDRRALCERATLEDIMFHVTRGGANA
jgi:ABC-2 type transport system ATP-binding protein